MVCINFVPVLISTIQKNHYCLSKKKKKAIPFSFNQSHLQSQSCSEVLDSPDCSFVHWKTAELVVCCRGCLFENKYSLSTFPSVYFLNK